MTVECASTTSAHDGGMCLGRRASHGMRAGRPVPVAVEAAAMRGGCACRLVAVAGKLLADGGESDARFSALEGAPRYGDTACSFCRSLPALPVSGASASLPG